MKHQYPRLLSVLCALMIATSASWAVPAYRGWQTRTQPDGTTITIRQVGDEFYHYWETEDGKIAAEQPDGTFIVTDTDLPTSEQVQARRLASKRYVKRALMVGAATKPERALFILVSFSNLSFKATSATYYKSKLGDATEGAMSMYNYLKQQSNGAYAPPVDVFGPVTLSSTYATYGANDSNGDDTNPAQMIADACLALDSQIDFSQYDSNSDGVVDNVYVLYAGKGEADGGEANTIWPHQWTLQAAGITLRLDGKYIRSYACSAELNGSGKCAMGTPLHEFGHVIGLPDYYDTEYKSTNYTESRTPGDWSIMDQGSYNNDGNTPPNYSIFDKYYLGWLTPKFLAKDAIDNVTLTTAYGDGYQITGGTLRVAYTNTNTVYYIENRQKSGWDAYLPGHGMVVWQVKYNATNWNNNNLNNTGGSPRYTVLSASGDPKNIGRTTDPFPGTGTVKTWTPFTGCALTDITESAGNISFKYNGGIDCHAVVTNGTGCTITPSTTCVENGNSFTATITPTDETYDYTSLTVKLGSTTLTSGTHYTLSADKKTLTINASAISGDASNNITITVVWTKNRYSYAMLGENCTAELSGTVAKNAALSLTIAPASGFTLADAVCWDVEMGGTPLIYGTGFTYNSSTNTFSITSVTGDVSILAYGGRSVTWQASGATFATTIGLNNKIALPASNPDDCTGGKKFVGWCTNGSYDHATVAPTFAKAGDTYSVGTYYAVYATATGGGAASWDLVTDASSLRSGDILVIASNTQGKTAGDISSAVMAEVASTFSSDKSSITSLGSETIELTLGGTEGAWTLTSSNGKLGATAVKKLVWDSGTQTWSISISGGNATIQNGTNSYGRFLHNTGSTRFTTYSSDTNVSMLLPQLYRKSAGVTYSYYTTTCVVCALTSISLNTDAVQKSFATDDTFNSTGLVVTANYSNCLSRTVTPASISTPDMTAAGSKTVTVSYTENGTTKTATYTINVVAPYTVTYKACGDVFTTQQYAPGAALVLPENPGGYDGLTFAGWTTTEHYTGASAPAFISAGGAVNADVTYYAVFH